MLSRKIAKNGTNGFQNRLRVRQVMVLQSSHIKPFQLHCCKPLWPSGKHHGQLILPTWVRTPHRQDIFCYFFMPPKGSARPSVSQLRNSCLSHNFLTVNGNSMKLHIIEDLDEKVCREQNSCSYLKGQGHT